MTEKMIMILLFIGKAVEWLYYRLDELIMSAIEALEPDLKEE